MTEFSPGPWTGLIQDHSAASTEFTAAEKLACADRELKMRRRVYPRWVELGKMSQKQADHEIACLESIVADYSAHAERERLL